ncbi:lipoyl synthase [Striga asiatica]|uniref:Lipoyl synthase n=1 Tax=Striga asiatica TaxID=4170 RepID=A0A5A7QXI5_STRAF|nr:lipoyl synthase [Striga asiatica]
MCRNYCLRSVEESNRNFQDVFEISLCPVHLLPRSPHISFQQHHSLRRRFRERHLHCPVKGEELHHPPAASVLPAGSTASISCLFSFAVDMFVFLITSKGANFTGLPIEVPYYHAVEFNF